MRYASETTVNVDRSRAEIERTLKRYGAAEFGYAWGAVAATIMFKHRNRVIRFKMPFPEEAELLTPTGLPPRNPQAASEQAMRQRWRALALAIKAKLELVESGITTFEQEFLAHVVLPNGQTVGEWAGPQIEDIYSKGKMPPLLPG